MRKRLMAILLATAMVLMLLPATALAVDEEFESGGIKYKVLTDPAGTIPGTAAVIANNYTGTSYTIPASVSNAGNDYTVTQIGTEAFRNCTNLTAITIPNSVTSMGDRAFQDCTSLVAASFPAVTIISERAFQGCTSLAAADFPAATRISASAFLGCPSLATASFPAAENILPDAFALCRNLASLSLPATPPTVRSQMEFVNCPDVRSLALVNASGAALTGQALNDAITAYDQDGQDGTGTRYDGKWYRWTLLTQPTAPGISGDTAMPLDAGYAATSTNAYTLTGSPTPTVTKLAGNASITWNAATNKLDIAAGLPVGTYPVELTAANSVSPNATLTFTLTVTQPAPPITITPTATFPQGGAPTNLTLNIGSAGSPPNTAADFGSLEIAPEGAGFTPMDAANYTVSYGSIHIALHQNWLNTLAPGAYTLRVNLAGAYPGIQLTTRLIVTAPGGTGDVGPDIPQAGDGSMPGLWAVLMLLAGAGLCVVRRKRRA